MKAEKGITSANGIENQPDDWADFKVFKAGKGLKSYDEIVNKSKGCLNFKIITCVLKLEREHKEVTSSQPMCMWEASV